jgi:hypothetical protein
MQSCGVRFTIMTLTMMIFAILFAALARHPSPGLRAQAGHPTFCINGEGRGCTSWL